MPRACPFCGAEVPGAACPACQRDPTAPRRVCSNCSKMTPSAEPPCMHCGTERGSELSWKIPVIVAIFVVALALAVALQAVR